MFVLRKDPERNLIWSALWGVRKKSLTIFTVFKSGRKWVVKMNNIRSCD